MKKSNKKDKPKKKPTKKKPNGFVTPVGFEKNKKVWI